MGKSTIANQLRKLGFEVFSGTDVASWPDKRWHQELLSKSIDDTIEGSDEHFKEKIVRSHELARKLSTDKDVVIDSDPFHKTLMHDYLRTNSIERLAERFHELAPLANLSPGNQTIHLQLRLDNDLDTMKSARILQKRIDSRGERAPFDPETADQSSKMIKANELIAEILKREGNTVIAISTSEPIGDGELLKFLSP